MSDEAIKRLQEEVDQLKLERDQAKLQFSAFQAQVSRKLDKSSIHYYKGSESSGESDNQSESSKHSYSKRSVIKDKLDDRGIKLDDFTGQGSPEDFLEWERQVDKIAEYKGFDDLKTFKIAYIRLTKHAGLW